MRRIKATFESGNVVEGDVTPRVEVDWEAHHNKAFGATFMGEPKRTEWYYLAWLAVKHAGHVVKPFDGFINELAEVTVVADGEGPKAETQ